MLLSEAIEAMRKVVGGLDDCPPLAAAEVDVAAEDLIACAEKAEAELAEVRAALENCRTQAGADSCADYAVRAEKAERELAEIRLAIDCRWRDGADIRDNQQSDPGWSGADLVWALIAELKERFAADVCANESDVGLRCSTENNFTNSEERRWPPKYGHE